MKVVFMGTPDFAVPSLKALIESGYIVEAVVTQPDKPKGRGYKISYPPVKEVAISNNIPVLQPEKIKNNYEFYNELKNYNPDVIVVVAYGKILPKEILELPRFGCINVHASLLPKYRGAAPINWAIINGEKQTGITIMYMEEKLDAGDIILQELVGIEEDDTAGILHDKLAFLGSKLLVKALGLMESGKAMRIPQKEEEATYAPMIDREITEIKWVKSSKEIVNLIRGLNPFPGAHTYYKDELIKIWRAASVDNADYGKPGEIVELGRDYILVSCGKGGLKILELQREGKKKLSAGEFLRGISIKVGDFFGT